MKRWRRPHGVLALTSGLVLAACSAQKASESPQAPTAAYGGASDAQAAPAASPGAPPPEPQKEAAKKAELRVTDAEPSQALADAEALLDAALGPDNSLDLRPTESARPNVEPMADACSIACRALASMRRSTERLCELAPSASPDAPRCDEAKDRVTKAERRVRERCASCATP